MLKKLRALWLHKFNTEGTVEAVISWAEGAIRRGLDIHLVIMGIPSPLNNIYRDYIKGKGLHAFLNISSQQVQNLIYYRGFNLLHAHHPDLYPLTGELGHIFKIPWLASCFETESSPGFSYLDKAHYVICPNSPSLRSIKEYFSPYQKRNLILIPPGIKSTPKNNIPLKSQRILYRGPLLKNHLHPFQELNKTVRESGFTLDVMSQQRPPQISGIFYHWDPDFSKIPHGYNIIISSGYYLLQGIAAGKIALIMENKYEGIFSPFTTVPVPDFRTMEETTAAPDIQKQLKEDLKLLQSQSLSITKLQDDNWRYARENHDLDLVGEKIARLYRRI